MEIHDTIEPGTLEIQQPYSFVSHFWALRPDPS